MRPSSGGGLSKEMRTASRQTGSLSRRLFCSTMRKRITARTTCINLADMAQRAGEVANRYHLRLFATFDKLQSTFSVERKAVKFAPAVSSWSQRPNQD